MWDGNNLVYINPSLSEYLLTGFTAYYGLGIFESNQNGTKYRYQRNAHGDTTALLNQSGDIVHCYIYEDAFGTSTYSADDTNPFRYAGQYYDRESQSYYLRARYYLPRYGRFSQQDTHWNTGNMLYGDNPVTLNGRQIPNYAAISQGLNLYTYCADNPVMFIDSSGENFLSDAGKFLYKVIEILCESTEAQVSVGNGVGLGVTIGNVEVSAGVHSDPFIAGIEKGELYTGYGGGYGVNAIVGAEYSYEHRYETGVQQFRDGHDVFTPFYEIMSCKNTTSKNTFSISAASVDTDGNVKIGVGGSIYCLIIGGSANVSFNITTFIEKIQESWEEYTK